MRRLHRQTAMANSSSTSNGYQKPSTTFLEEREDDEDIPSSLLSSATTEQATSVESLNLPYGPITRARARLLKEQVNLFLPESHNVINENFILPKIVFCLCSGLKIQRWTEIKDMRMSSKEDHQIRRQRCWPMAHSAKEKRAKVHVTKRGIKTHVDKHKAHVEEPVKEPKSAV